MALSAVWAQQRYLPLPTGDDPPVVSLLTAAPGQEVYQLEGHSGLRLEYDGVDLTVNWGLFDFDSPGFVYRFVKGETDYSVGVSPTYWFLEMYAREGRQVVSQRLNLTPEEALRVIELVENNLQPGNRVYRYNYVKDNCATRPLKIVEKAVGDKIVIAGNTDGGPTTFRDEMRHFHKHYPWYQFGIDLALGKGLDYEIDEHATAFAPVTLRNLVADAVVVSTDGKERPLVSTTQILVAGPEDGTVNGPTLWCFTPLASTILLLLVCIVSCWAMNKRRRVIKWPYMVVFTVYGLIGCIIAYLVFISVHEAASPNYLLTWLNPVCLAVPALILIRRCERILAWLMAVNLLGMTVYAIVICVGVQDYNGAFIPMLVADALLSVMYLKFKLKNK